MVTYVRVAGGKEKLTEHGELVSVRRQAKRTQEILNEIARVFGVKVHWDSYERASGIKQYMNRGIIQGKAGEASILFSKHGNKYADYLVLQSIDTTLLEKIRVLFPEDFPSGVTVKEGLLF